MKWDSWFKRRRWEARMDAEFRLHLDSQISDYVSQGLSREEAELRARREFGPIELAKDECRDQRPVEWLDLILRDIRYACRGLRKSPGFAAAAVMTLARDWREYGDLQRRLHRAAEAASVFPT